MVKFVVVVLLAASAVKALPYDPASLGPDGTSDVAGTSRYNPDAENVYHLFTRENPQISQVIVLGNQQILANTNFDASKRIVFIVHGRHDNAISDLNAVLVPAFLEVDDANVIVVDWSAGSGGDDRDTAVANVPICAAGVARFITWLNAASGADFSKYHILGHGFGGHLVGIVGRHLDRQVPYITALDPAFLGFIENDQKFTPDVGIYTEVIHTNIGDNGYIGNLGKVDFYPNGGITMPGCVSALCSHHRSFHFFAESLRQGGFKGIRCEDFIAAMNGDCHIPEHLNMGGLEPKTGSVGIYHFLTRAAPPFSLT